MTYPFLQYLTLGLLLFLLLVFLISARKPKPQPNTKEQSQKTISKSRRDEILDSLEWMQQNQILDNTEYNKLLVKCLPFLE